MTSTRTAQGQVTLAGSVRVGDDVLIRGRRRTVTRIRKAQGRKPPIGENLHFVAGDDVVKINSTHPIRVYRPAPAQ